MKILIAITFLNLIFISLYGQDEILIVQKIRSADTILFVRHKPSTFVYVDEVTNKKHFPYKVVTNNRLNPASILQRQIITKPQIEKLITIFELNTRDRIQKSCNSFIPTHAIILIKNGLLSYVELSFPCNFYLVSNGSRNPEYLDSEKSNKLELLFKDAGINTD